MGADVFVPFVFFGFLAAVILIPIWLRERTKQSAHHLISQALEKGQPLDPALMRDLTQGSVRQQQGDRPRRTLGSAILMLALAGAFGAIYFVNRGENDWSLVPAIILGALGGAFLLLAIVDYTTKKKDV
ncbi:MAG: hypothetical protein JSS00_02245 [Proteobacteria bacterium]|nr:hypothetical protein [Pseudomonadota bacterium]